ncbi:MULTISPECIES: hypothetical protein [Cupriavidus]
MRKIFFFLMFLSCSVQATDCKTNADFVIDSIYGDPDYRQFVCANNDCSVNDFANSIAVDQVLLGGDLIGCFATPVRKARNYYTGFYVIEKGKIRSQFTFFGAWLAPKKDAKTSPAPLVGVEYIEAGEFERHQFSWNGRDYRETKVDEE